MPADEAAEIIHIEPPEIDIAAEIPIADVPPPASPEAAGKQQALVELPYREVRERMRQNVVEWLRSGEFERIMKKSKIPTTTHTGDFRRISEVANLILSSVELVPGGAPIPCEETASSLALKGIRAVQGYHEGIRERHRKLNGSPEFERLRQESIAGFDNLSNPNVFLDPGAMKALSQKTIDKACPNELKSVRQKLSEDLLRSMSSAAEGARGEFRLYVRYIFFGTEGFGRRDRFIVHQGDPARRAAIEDVIYEMIKNHPDYVRAKLEAPFVKDLVSTHAKALTEAISGVPRPSA